MEAHKITNNIYNTVEDKSRAAGATGTDGTAVVVPLLKVVR